MTHTISNIIDLTNAPTPPRWFEFLLEPGRLQQHLGTQGCDPSPTQLISLFFRNTPIIESNTPSHLSPASQRNGLNQLAVPSTQPVVASSPTTTNGNSTPPATAPNTIPGNQDAKSRIPQVTTEETEVKPTEEQVEKVLIDYNDSVDISIPPDSYEAKYRTKKAYALQMLSVKVASYLKWDLDILCNNLTIPIQYKLVQALNNACSFGNCPPEVSKFANLTYCHWFLRSAITYQLSTLQPQSSNTTIIYLSQLQQQQQAADSSALSSMGELFAPNSKQLKSCSHDLHTYVWELTHNKNNSTKRIKGSGHPFKKAKLSRPTVDCFDSRDEKFNDWDKCETIEPVEFLEAACYDLGRFFFFEESYALAKESFEIIKNSREKFPKLDEYLKSATELASPSPDEIPATPLSEPLKKLFDSRAKAERYLYECMEQYKSINKQKEDQEEETLAAKMEIDATGNGETKADSAHLEGDCDMRIVHKYPRMLPGKTKNEVELEYGAVPELLQQQGDTFMSKGQYREAMGCFVGAIMILTKYFKVFSKDYLDEEAYIMRMIQCSISLSCFTQAVCLCQMTKTINYTIAFKQLNERVCNDCCDDMYECIWDVTLLEYIINLHTKRGEVERRTRVIQLIGQLELNENNPEEILREAEHVKRGRFFRIMSNKYL